MPIGNWTNKIYTTILFVVMVVVGTSSWAQGNGLLIGETRLHLGLGLEGGYDTNVRYLPDKYALSDAQMNIKPRIELKTPEKAVSFEIDGTLNIIKYFGVEDESTVDNSTLNADANLNLTFNPKGQLKFVISDIFSRNNDPRSDAIGNFNRTSNSAGASIGYTPSGGAFELNLGYNFYFDLYDKDTGLEYMDAIAHQPELKIKWKFFTKTALVIDSSMDIRSYPNSTTVNNVTIQNQDQMGIRATAGLMGLMTPRLSTTIKAGYGDTLSSKGDNYRSVIGKFELTYDFNIQSRTSLGYIRDFQPASLYGYYGIDKIYAKFSYLFGGRLQLDLEGAFSYELFGKPLVEDANLKGNTDLVFELGGSIEFMINKLLTIGIRERYLVRNSNRRDIGNEDISYSKNLSILFIKFYY
ncbi:MAG: outer membrane beta-barrel protein [Deltaproteobacteria bacterium]|nr:outer membrane beta-barrel protein [Deltaproteobacteria bacterium]